MLKMPQGKSKPADPVLVSPERNHVQEENEESSQWIAAHRGRSRFARIHLLSW